MTNFQAIKNLLLIGVASAALAGYGGADDIASPGEGVIVLPAPTSTPAPTPTPTPTPTGPAASCPTGTTDAGVIADLSTILGQLAEKRYSREFEATVLKREKFMAILPSGAD